MTEQLQHRYIDPRECPRCGSLRTESLGRDGTPTETRLCTDCRALDPDNDDAGLYDIVYGDEVQSVNLDNGEETIYDTDYLIRQAAKDLLAACEGLLEQVTGPAMVWGDGRGNDGKKTGLSHQEFNALRDQRIAAARAALAKAKGEQA